MNRTKADKSIETKRLTLSERDSLRVLDLLENPSAAPDRLVRAAKAGFTLSLEPRLGKGAARTMSERARK